MSVQNYLTVKEKSAYAMGDIATNFFFKFFQFFLFYYYTDSVGLSAGVVGTMFLVSRLLDTITDPAMGAIADRTRSRWGSYRPYLLFMAVPYGICGYLMFLNPQFSDDGKLIYAFITYSMMMLAFTAINIPYASLSGVMTPHSHERTVLSSYRFVGAFGGGLLLTLMIRPLVRLLGGEDEAEGFRLTMALFAVISIFLFVVTFAFCKERIKPSETQSKSIKNDLKSLMQNRPWQILTLSYVLGGTYISIHGAVTIHFFKYWVGDGGEPIFLIFDLATVFLVVGLLFNAIGAASTKWLTRFFDKRSLIIGLSALNALVLFLFFVAKDGNTSVLFLLQVLNGFLFGPTPVLIWSMYADTADYGEHRFHHRNTGMIFSAALFGLKLGLATGGAVAGWVLVSTGFVGNTEQDAQSLFGILLCFSIIPGVAALLKAFILYYYPLKDEDMIQIERDLVERKGELHAPKC